MYHILFLIFMSYTSRQNQVYIKKVRIRIFSKFPFKEGKPKIKMTECSKERDLHSEIYVVLNFQYQFSITCKNWMHKVSELLSKIYNLSPKCSHPHPHNIQREASQNFRHQREESHNEFFSTPYSKHFHLYHTFNNLLFKKKIYLMHSTQSQGKNYSQTLYSRSSEQGALHRQLQMITACT